jgi:hypothetical protein
MRAPAAARSLSYAAKPSWSSYQALQSQYVWRSMSRIPAGQTLNILQTILACLPVAPVQHDP